MSLELLFAICSFEGFELVHHAAKSYSQKKGIPLYSNVVTLLGRYLFISLSSFFIFPLFLLSLLKSGDIETQVNALTFINTLIDMAPPAKAVKILNALKGLGIQDVLKGQNKILSPAFKTQLSLFEVNAGVPDQASRENRGIRQKSMKELEAMLDKFPFS